MLCKAVLISGLVISPDRLGLRPRDDAGVDALAHRFHFSFCEDKRLTPPWAANHLLFSCCRLRDQDCSPLPTVIIRAAILNSEADPRPHRIQKDPRSGTRNRLGIRYSHHFRHTTLSQISDLDRYQTTRQKTNNGADRCRGGSYLPSLVKTPSLLLFLSLALG